jgi:hypothetical protein
MPRVDHRVLVAKAVSALLACLAIGTTWAQGPTPAASAPAAELPACALVFGHGRNFVAEMPAANAHWNDLNQRFTQGVAQAIQATGRRAVTMVLPVESRDLQANLSQLLQRASDEGCEQVVEATVLGDPGTELLIARLRVHAIGRLPGPPRLDSNMNIGEPEVTVQRELPLTQRTLTRLTSNELAQQLSAEILPHLRP